MTTQLGMNLTAGQREIATSVRDFQTTVVQSANAVGKTYVAGGIATWFLRCFEHSKVITAAAPPLENLERLLWGEIGTRVMEHPEVFADMTVGHLRVQRDAEWWLVGRAIPGNGTEKEREAKFSGVHAPYLLFVVDEGDAVPDEVYQGIESCMSGGFVRLLVLFNPRAPRGPVYRMIQSGQAHVVTLDALTHPNVVSGDDRIPGAVTRATTVRRIADWSRALAADEPLPVDSAEWFQVPGCLAGETAIRPDGTLTSPLVGGQWRKVVNPALSYMVLALFPGQAENQLINREWVEQAQARWRQWRALYGDKPPEGRPIHGQDVAEFGIDNNSECFRYGGWVAPFVLWGGLDIAQTGDRAARDARARNARRSYVDATGVGAGVPPVMRRWWKAQVYAEDEEPYRGVAVPVHVGGAPTETVEEGAFGTLRDQLWWRCREWLRTDATAMLPDTPGLADELCTATYQVRGGVIKVMAKDQMRKLLGRSPDEADSLCLTFSPDDAGSAYLGWMKTVGSADKDH